MKSIIALTDFKLVLPKLQMSQEDTIDHILNAHCRNPDIESEKLRPLLKRYAIKPNQISKRHFENIELSKNGTDILERAQFFAERGRQVVADFYSSSPAAPEHLIHVTCTGYVSPSPVQHLVNDREWTQKTDITHAYHMGCYASLPAVRIAEGLIASRYKKVDIVHTEMCALHMDRNDHSAEQMVVQSLFADGHIKYSAVPADLATSGYKVLAIQELIAASWGMKMTLSRDVPEKIASSLRPFVLKLCEKANVDFSEILKSGLFAIHPGGPKIIDSVQQGLELSDEQVSSSRQILFERGNMSSATLPHVWELILKNRTEKTAGKKVLSLAFGPGLTIFGALFEII